jgi:hypothetical protein
VCGPQDVDRAQNVDGGVGGVYTYNIGVAKIDIPINAKRIWIILAPSQCIETAGPIEQMTAVGTSLNTPSARTVVASNGIYAFSVDAGPRHLLARLWRSGAGPSFPAWIAAALPVTSCALSCDALDSPGPLEDPGITPT